MRRHDSLSAALRGGRIGDALDGQQKRLTSDVNIYQTEYEVEFGKTCPIFAPSIHPDIDWWDVMSAILDMVNQYTYDGDFTLESSWTIPVERRQTSDPSRTKTPYDGIMHKGAVFAKDHIGVERLVTQRQWAHKNNCCCSINI